MKRKKLNEMNQEIMQQSNLKNQIQLKHQRKQLKRELNDAIKESKDLENSRVNDFLKMQKFKQQRLNDMQKQIEMHRKAAKMNEDANSKEVNYTMKHEFDLLGINEARHKHKISELVQRNDKIYKSNQPRGLSTLHNGYNRNHAQHDLEPANSLVMNMNNEKDMSEEDRHKRSREILDIYKRQMQTKFEKDKKRSNHKRLVERVLVDKQSEITYHQMHEEKLKGIRKKMMQKEALDKQIQENRKINQEKLTTIYV